MVVFAPLSVNVDYADMALRHTMVLHLSPSQALQWMADNDELTRGTMLALMRDGYPQGEALVEALREHRQDWKTGLRSITPHAKRSRQNVQVMGQITPVPVPVQDLIIPVIRSIVQTCRPQRPCCSLVPRITALKP